MSTTTSEGSSAAGIALACLIVGGIAMGLSPLFVRLADVGPLASGFFRLALALPLLTAIGSLQGGNTTPGKRTVKEYALFIAAGLFFGADVACWHLSITYTTVAEATLLAILAPVLVAIGSLIIFKERMTRLFMTGLILAVTGTASLILQRHGGALPVDRPLGIMFGLGAAVTYACYMFVVRELRRTESTSRIVIWSTAVSALVLLPLALESGDNMVPRSLAGLAALLAMALMSHAGGQSALTFALAHLPVSFSSMVQMMQALTASIAAWVFLSEPLTPSKALSGLTILAGIWLARMGSTSRA